MSSNPKEDGVVEVSMASVEELTELYVEAERVLNELGGIQPGIGDNRPLVLAHPNRRDVIITVNASKRSFFSYDIVEHDLDGEGVLEQRAINIRPPWLRGSHNVWLDNEPQESLPADVVKELMGVFKNAFAVAQLDALTGR